MYDLLETTLGTDGRLAAMIALTPEQSGYHVLREITDMNKLFDQFNARADAPNDQVADHLESPPPAYTRSPPRNALCPCGSGRKAKRCHAGRVPGMRALREIAERERVRLDREATAAREATKGTAIKLPGRFVAGSDGRFYDGGPALPMHIEEEIPDGNG